MKFLLTEFPWSDLLAELTLNRMSMNVDWPKYCFLVIIENVTCHLATNSNNNNNALDGK